MAFKEGSDFSPSNIEPVESGQGMAIVVTPEMVKGLDASLIENLADQIEALENEIAGAGPSSDVVQQEQKLAMLENDLGGVLNAIEPSAQDKETLADLVGQNQEIAENKGDIESVAEDLAAIEPAAGDGASDSSGGGGAGGYGFQSDIQDADFNGREDIGAIGATQLEYGVEYREDEVGLTLDNENNNASLPQGPLPAGGQPDNEGPPVPQTPQTDPVPDPVPDPILRVGENVSDENTSDTPHRVGDADGGALKGAGGADVLIGDVGGSALQNQVQNHNFLFVVDVSGSMNSRAGGGGETHLSLLTKGLEDLFADLGGYASGDVKVHIAPFAAMDKKGASFTVTDPADLDAAKDYLQSLKANGTTNYEAGLQSGIEWLQSGDALPGANVTTYFISDGEPNRYVTNSGKGKQASAQKVMNEISGADGTDEITILNTLSDEVIGIGVDIGGAITRIEAIDSDGQALNIKDPSDLGRTLAETNPLLKMAGVGDDSILGKGGDDVIFGDSVNTDELAMQHSLGTAEGAGWDVFEALEAGQSALKIAWDKAATLDYVLDNADDLAAESVDVNGQGRAGGDDVLRGGEGDDRLYGQEGNDTLYGDAGNDILSGGSGADSFMLNAISQGVDVIRDFGADEGDVLDFSSVIKGGFDPAQQAIDDFVFAREEQGGTILSVDISGSGDVSKSIDLVALEGVQNMDLQAMLEAGNINLI